MRAPTSPNRVGAAPSEHLSFFATPKTWTPVRVSSPACTWVGLGRTTPADSVRGGAEVGTGGGGHRGLRRPDVPPTRQMPLMPHAQARECFCGFMGRLSDGAIGGALRHPELELHHSDESGVGARALGGSGGNRLVLVMRILEGLGRWPLARWQGAVRRRD